MSARQYEITPGSPHPLGATPDATGVNFSVFSWHATGVELLLFDSHDDAEPAQVVALDPHRHRTYGFWHCNVEGLEPGAHYAFRVHGPWVPEQGHRFMPSKVLIDPYARGNTNALWDRASACGEDDNLHTSMRSVVIDAADYDWEGDRPLHRPMQDTVIYEMHVGGFTKSGTAGVTHPGTFHGVIEKITYLQALGVTAVELLPVMEFDETEILREMEDGTRLSNYWGYSTLSFFAPDSSYCVSPEFGTHLAEFRDMVKALHRAGIEIIMDVVFNHTNEGNHQGPVINFKGFDNSIYYYLVDGQRQYYMDYTGCGNTMNCNHPIVDKFVVDCLEFWVREMHVDGFRFDEGSVLSRDESGAPIRHPPLLWNIELSEELMDTKIIAEAWDAAGLYQIGAFPGHRWAEWNGRYRDAIRRFVRGDAGLVSEVATRMAGSADIYQSRGRLPRNSVNFIDCHDGFTMNDLVSYNQKHNDANGEGNRDGIDENLSWNGGVEGDTNDPAIESLRERQIRNFFVILLLSQGVPMFLMGDEIRRTQQGNNNTYCLDNELNWMDWSRCKTHGGLLQFCRRMIGFRARHAALRRGDFFDGSRNARGLPDITWHGTRLYQPGWDDPQARVLAFTLAGFDGEDDLHVMMNMYWDGLFFELPIVPDRAWHRVVDTGQPSPNDFVDEGTVPPCLDATYCVGGRSVVVLVSKPNGGKDNE